MWVSKRLTFFALSFNLVSAGSDGYREAIPSENKNLESSSEIYDFGRVFGSLSFVRLPTVRFGRHYRAIRFLRAGHRKTPARR